MRLLVVVIALVAACAANVDPNDAQQMQDLLNWLKTEDRDEEGLLENTSDVSITINYFRTLNWGCKCSLVL